MIDNEELLGQLHAYANNRHHSFVTLQQMARESAAAIEELRAQIAAKDAALRALVAAWDAVEDDEEIPDSFDFELWDAARAALAPPAQETE